VALIINVSATASSGTPPAQPDEEVLRMQERAQGGGEIHTCDECGEVLPTEQELEQHRQQQHGGSVEPRQAIGGVTGE
jgi:hypothetical protein